jgi:hypothetical protein
MKTNESKNGEKDKLIESTNEFGGLQRVTREQGKNMDDNWKKKNKPWRHILPESGRR